MTWSELYALAPVLILALGSTALLMVGAWWPARKPLFYGGIVLALAAAVVAVVNEPAVAEVARLYGTGPYGRFFTALWSLAGALTLLLSLRYSTERHLPPGEYVALLLFAVAGMALLSSATSLVGLFLGLEAYTLVLYILIAFHKESEQGAEAGLKYLVMGAVSTGFLAFGIALIYTASGSFHLPEALLPLAAGGELRPISLCGWILLLTALGFKVSLVPFHLWTADVYQGAPAPVAAFLATGSKGAVFAALISLLAAAPRAELAPLLWALAALSMLWGTLVALRQNNLKRLLAYSSIVHMGFVLTALLAGGKAGWSAGIFYLVTYTAMGLGAFGIIASLADGCGEPQDEEALRNLGYSHPWRAAALTVFLLSLAGIPATAGFIGKFGIFHAALTSGYSGLAFLGILASLVSVFYYLRVIIVMYMTAGRGPSHAPAAPAEMLALLVCLATTLACGLYPQPLWKLIVTFAP